YREGPVCILPHLYLGTEVNAANQALLRKLGIRYILNVAKEVPDRFRYKKFNWGHNQEDLLEFFENAFSFIDHGRSHGDGVLVHCQCGVSRSASLVLAYVMRNQRMPLHEAYTFVKERSSAISPNMSLFYQLVDFE
ncbi:Mkp-4, partial [Syncephalis pseudoplumigaleata]